MTENNNNEEEEKKLPREMPFVGRKYLMDEKMKREPGVSEEMHRKNVEEARETNKKNEQVIKEMQEEQKNKE